ncbi:MAG: hypothetical protein QOI68_5649, partial [Pseudonocardiales bacterium]|nr:hypothetical protein [Pseudonocardiales bacterium]
MVTPVSAEWSPETTRHSRAQNSRAQNAADVVGTVVDPEM